jgi:hypothetical protein
MWKWVSIRPPVISISRAENSISHTAIAWRVSALPGRLSTSISGSAVSAPPRKIAAHTWTLAELSPPAQVVGER